MDVELRQLRVFLTVASELHFSRAAARLHISQPALSQQIRTLEKALGTPLFDRTSRATELTPAGRVLLDAAPRVLFEADRARTRVAQAAEGASGLLVVGSVGTALASIAPQILRTLRTRFPDLQLQVSQHDTAFQMVALAEERLDVGLVRAAAATAAVVVEMLVAEPLLVALPADHVLALRDTVDPADLAGEPFVLWPRPLGTDFFDIIVGYCREHGFSPSIVAEGPDIETQLSLVAAGIGISLQPSYYANLRPPGVEFRPLSGTVPTVALQVAWRRRDRSPAVRHFLDAARVSAPGTGGTDSSVPASPGRTSRATG